MGDDGGRSSFADKLLGSQVYLDHDPMRAESNARIYVVARLGGRRTLLMLDTGAPWCIAPDVGPTPSPGDPRRCLGVRGDEVWGHLTRGALEIEAEFGESLLIEPTFFVPDDPDHWPHPSFLGLSALSSVVFGVDGTHNRLHFGQ